MKRLRIRLSHLLWITLVCCIGAAAYHRISEQSRTIDQLVNELDEARMQNSKLERQQAMSSTGLAALTQWRKAAQDASTQQQPLTTRALPSQRTVDDMREEKVLESMAQ